MSHTRALALAALLRCRRRVHTALLELQAYAFQLPQEGHIPVSTETWHRFEQRELRESVKGALPLHTIIMCHAVLASVARLGNLVESDESAPEGGNLWWAIAQVLLFVFAWFANRLSLATQSSSQGSTKEWPLSILFQCTRLSISLGFALIVGSDATTSDLQVHRTFLLRFLPIYMVTSVAVYLPHQYHILFVTLQGPLIWIWFHWAHNYLRLTTVLIGFLLPVAEHSVYRFNRNRSWLLFSLAEKETNERILSDTLRQALRGALNVTFDASCECDETGRILHSSQHLQQLLTNNSSDLVGVGLQSLAANPAEAVRLSAFFQQISQQRQSTAPGTTCPPALLGTVLKCLDTKLEVKLCCVPLPADCTVYEVAPSDSCQRFFVGWQTIQATDSKSSVFDGEEQEEIQSSNSQRSSGASLVAASGSRFRPPNPHTSRHDVIQRTPSEAKSEASFTLSMTTTKTVPLAESRDAAVQTVLTAGSTLNVTQPPSSLPRQENAQPRRRPPVPHSVSRVVLNTSKRVLKQFKVTPKRTIFQLVVETIRRTNPQGKGCCFSHIALQVFLRATNEMIAMKCDPLKPNDAWQCGHCLVLHPADSDAEEDSDGRDMCSFCHQPDDSASEGDAAVAEEENSSTNAADNEHD